MTTKNSFFTRFNPPPSKAEDTSKPSITEQQFSFQCDINNLVKTIVDTDGKQHAQLTHAGITTDINGNQPIYGDFTQFTSDGLMNAMHVVADAKSKFAELPSSIRDRFNNDPAQLIDFVHNKDNYEEGVKLGLFKKRAQQDVVDNVISKVTVTPPVVTTAPVVAEKQ